MRERTEYLLVKLFLGIAKIAPKSFVYAFSKMLALVLYHLDAKRRTLTITNLSRAFPEMSEERIKTLSKEVYAALSKSVAEILLMFVDRFDIDEAVENLEEAKEKIRRIAESGERGVIVVTAHFSNWELAAHFLAKHGLPMLAIGREGNNKLIDRHITIPFREKYGNKAVKKDHAMLAMAKQLKQGKYVGLLIDQKSGHLNSAKVDFFGALAETTLSVAMLKEKFDPLVVPIFIVRQENGKYHMHIEEPISYKAEEIEVPHDRLAAMTQRYSDAIEKIVRAYPAQWFWMHNRWRR